MNIIVCVKQVVDTENLIEISEETSVNTSALPRVVNAYDLVALEQAIQLKENGVAEEVLIVSVGGPSVDEVLYEGMAMGADKAILLCDPAFDGSDSHATSLVLAKAISLLQYSLILCGQKASDTEAGQVGYYLAEMLGIPVISGAIRMEVSSDEKVIVHRKLKGGFRDVLEAPLPAVVSVERGLNEPRYVGLRAVSRARKKEVKQYAMRDLGLSSGDVGQSGSKTRIVSVSRPRPKKIFVPDSNLSAMERLMQVESGGIAEKEGSTISGSPQEVASKLVQIFLSRKVLRI